MDADLFSEGSIYYYENTSRTKKDYYDSSINKDFLVSRPVYILKSNPISFDTFTINVLPITSSSKRVGIPINIDGLKDGKILPYSIYSVHRENLTTYMGRVSDEMISSVRDAVQYHLGYSDVVPQYMADHDIIMKKLNDKINKMTVLEKTVYDFLEKKCAFDSNFYAEYNELFRLYRKVYQKTGYTRSQDFSRILNKLMEFHPSVELKVENQIKRYYGLSIIGNIHKTDIDKGKELNTKRNAENSIVLLSPNSELSKHLSDEGKKVYDRLDIIQKISNYYSSPNNMDIEGIPTEDKQTIKKMIENDVNKRKKKVLAALDKGESPLGMNDIDQYVIYICTDNEILDHLSSKYRKPGGVNRLKRIIRQNIHHFFNQIKME